MFIPSVKTVWWQGFASSYEVNLQFGGKGVGERGWGKAGEGGGESIYRKAISRTIRLIQKRYKILRVGYSNEA